MFYWQAIVKLIHTYGKLATQTLYLQNRDDNKNQLIEKISTLAANYNR